MEPFPRSSIDTPATYRICVTGIIESSRAQRYWGMTSTSVQMADKQEQSILLGEIADQAALVGIINALYNFGHSVVSVERIPIDVNIDENNEQVEL
jgi:hypothetical protein